MASLKRAPNTVSTLRVAVCSEWLGRQNYLAPTAGIRGCRPDKVFCVVLAGRGRHAANIFARMAASAVKLRKSQGILGMGQLQTCACVTMVNTQSVVNLVL
jgi:hypothetical protein